jgi:acetate kinase
LSEHADPRAAAAASAGLAGRSCILTINGGSSSLKFSVYQAGEPPVRLVSGRVERIHQAGARLLWSDAGPAPAHERAVVADDHAAAAALVVDVLDQTVGTAAIAIVGHRVVHGGPRFDRPVLIDEDVMNELRRIESFDPTHLPGEIALIEAFGRMSPARPQVACFDTAFHHTLCRPAQILPIPRRLEALGVRRYGFHGLSYAYLMEELSRKAGEHAARGRVILAHLGAGASMAAVRAGTCLDTTMGFTPAAGLVMATRSGDVDPGLVRFLASREGLTPEQFDHMVNHESGLLGISETSGDVRDLLACEPNDLRAAEAIEVFCYQAAKWVGALAAALGGIDTLVFSGGIGENSSVIRRRICDPLGFLGIAIDGSRNEGHAPVISPERSPVVVRVIPTDEEQMIARESARFLERPA